MQGVRYGACAACLQVVWHSPCDACQHPVRHGVVQVLPACTQSSMAWSRCCLPAPSLAWHGPGAAWYKSGAEANLTLSGNDKCQFSLLIRRESLMTPDLASPAPGLIRLWPVWDLPAKYGNFSPHTHFDTSFIQT
jgi:hypothetical protein